MKPATAASNNWLVAVLAVGEGWHNNHHAQPRCAAAGHHWWELDPSHWAICAFAMVGLATELVPVRPVDAAQDDEHGMEEKRQDQPVFRTPNAP